MTQDMVERVLLERVAQAIYARHPAMTSSQFHRYPYTYDDAKAYEREEVAIALNDAQAAIEATGVVELLELAEACKVLLPMELMCKWTKETDGQFVPALERARNALTQLAKGSE